MRPPDDPTDELTELAGDQGEGEVGNELRDETQVDLEEDTSQPTPCTSPKPKDASQPSTEERSSASPSTGLFSSPENEETNDEHVVRQLHAALTIPKHFPFNPQAEAFVPTEQQSAAERQEEELTELKQTNADTTQGGFEPGQCIVCEKPTYSRIRTRGIFQVYCCDRCYADPAEESDENPDHDQSEESDDFLYRQTWLTESDDALATHQPIQFCISRQT